jgi:hypothetical protein
MSNQSGGNREESGKASATTSSQKPQAELQTVN